VSRCVRACSRNSADGSGTARLWPRTLADYPTPGKRELSRG